MGEKQRLLTHILIIYKFDEYFKKIWRKEKAKMFDTHDYLIFKKFGLDFLKIQNLIVMECN
jgi:hypothetical protein